MRVLMMTQALDPADPVLAFTVGWVRALARRVAHLDVLCLRQAATALPSNVTVWTASARTEKSRARRFVEFERVVSRLVPKVDVVFSHMVPRYACCAAPMAIAARRPVVLWYVHRRDSFELRLATAFCRFVATAARDTFPFATRKMRVLGHGVDDRFFTPAPRATPAAPQTLVFVGRLARIKGQATLLRALGQLDPKHDGVRVAFVGPPDGGTYEQSLRDLAVNLGLDNRVRFVGPQDADGVLDWYRCAVGAVNLSPTGLFDKAALESMMSGTLTIVASPSFDELLGQAASWLRVSSPDDPGDLARALGNLLTLSEIERRHLAEEIRRRTVAAHALDQLMDRLVLLMQAARP